MSTLKVDTIDTTNSSGNITVSRPLSGSGASLTSLPAANLTGTIAAISGANLTNLNATNLASGTVATARLGSGTANNTVFLRGDGTWAVAGVSGITDNSDAVAITIDSSERVGIGTGSPAQLLHLAGSSPTIRVDSSTTSDDAKLALTRQGSATLRGEVYYDSDQGILMMENLYDSSGADIIFRTRVGGTAVEGLRIKGTGELNIKSGIKFPATQVASSDVNTIDDYEEGTWTPVIQDVSFSNSEGQTYNTQFGKYTKVGNMVCLVGSVQTSSLGTLGGNLRFGGFPFTIISGGSSAGYMGFCSGMAITAGATPLSFSLDGNTTAGPIWQHTVSTGVGGISTTQWSADGNAYINAVYLTA